VVFLDVFRLQEPVLHLDVSRLPEPVLRLALPALDRAVLHLEVSSVYYKGPEQYCAGLRMYI
jgi:hypothetical protein